MDKKQRIKMIFSFILPPILAIALFAAAIGMVIVPATEEALMEQKQDIIQAIVTSATSILEKHAQMEKDGIVTPEESKQAALTEMRALRYGDGNKDYLWITDLRPTMVMHPYFPELEGRLLDQYTDSDGRLFFVEAVEIAKNDNEGYIHYMWPRQHNMEDSLPKLSYIRLFEPWGWVVGSGIYLDDVHAEIRAVTLRLIMISGGVGIIVMALLLFVIQRGWKSETGRCLAEKELIRSRERYQALAHASGEMIFLTIDGVIAAANKKACEILGKNEDEIVGRPFQDLLIEASDLDPLNDLEHIEGANTAEIALYGKNGPEQVILTAEGTIVNENSAILYAGYVCQLKDASDNSLIIQKSLEESGFGILILENAVNGKIISADQRAADLFKMEDCKHLLGLSFRSLLYEKGASQFFTQINMDKKVENLLLRFSDPARKVAYFRAWAVELAAKTMKGQVMVFLMDVTRLHLVNCASESLLSELLSPDRRLLQTDLLKMVPVEEKEHQHFIRTKVILREFIKMGLDVDKITAMTSRSIDGIFDYAVKKAIASIGPPPCPYALLAVGSIGRLEPTLNADQDTAIIFESGDADSENAEYFHRFADVVTSICIDAGIPACTGGHTAVNPVWCMNLKEWKHKFLSWIQTSLSDDLLKINIFFDFRTVSGDDALTMLLRQHIFKEVEQNPGFLFYLAQNTLDFRLPSDILGRIRSESRYGNHMNLKGAMLHFVNFARIYALSNGIYETNTSKRLQALMDSGCLPPDILQDTIDAWRFLLGLRYKNQTSAMDTNFPQENTLILGDLSTWDQMMLKRAMGQVSHLQRRLSSDIVRIG